ncbi:ABC transporter ATP-binding protein [Longispora sp. NPDC051575]|uniref:ABC transporter ATP-binding protein n=1 Tax=Longispora sp. NPDC051575 TaxID=3154943 RepID=UPI0034242406
MEPETEETAVPQDVDESGVVEEAEGIVERAPLPVVSAHNLGLRTGRGWVFRDVTVSVHPGELICVAGPAASGRSSLLLALAGRFTTNHGTLTLPKQHWKHLALGYVPGVHEPEPALTVGEHFRERRVLLGRRGERNTDRTLARDLSPFQRHVLCLELALLGRPRVIVVDDVDTALTGEEQAAFWGMVREVADAGTAVVAVSREPSPVADHVLTLTKEK